MGRWVIYISSELLVLWGNQPIWSLYTLRETHSFRTRCHACTGSFKACTSPSSVKVHPCQMWLENKPETLEWAGWNQHHLDFMDNHSGPAWQFFCCLRREEMSEHDSFVFYEPLALQLGGSAQLLSLFLYSAGWADAHQTVCTVTKAVSSPCRNINVIQSGRAPFWCSALSDWNTSLHLPSQKRSISSDYTAFYSSLREKSGTLHINGLKFYMHFQH